MTDQSLENGELNNKKERPNTLRLNCKLDLPVDADSERKTESAESLTKGEVDNTPGAGWRHIQLLLMYLALTGQMTHRTCLSVAIVAMTEPMTPGQKVFSWNREQQGAILSAFLWGYAVTQVPAGYLTTRFGAKNILGIALLCSSIITLFTPLVASSFGWVGLTVIRVLLGLFQGTTFPGLYTLLGKWAVPQERGKASGVGFAAQPTGIFLGMAVSGVLAENLGWPSIFYFFGCFTAIIAVIWFIFCAESPDVHRWISNEERIFILDAIGKESKIVKGPTPWRAILTSVPVWSSVLNVAGSVYGLWMLMTAMPRYMKDIFDYSMTMNGVASALPYIVTILISMFCGWISDIIIRKRILSVNITRKMFNTIGCWLPSASLITLAFTPNDHKNVQLFELVAAVGFMGCTYSGVLLNFVEISPRFAGLTFSISNFVGSIVAAIAPVITGVFVQTWGETTGWAAAFLFAGGLFFFTGLIWIIGASCEQQPWNDIGTDPLSNNFNEADNPEKGTGIENHSFHADKNTDL